MAGAMRAAVLYGQEDLRVEEAPAQVLPEGGVRIQIEAALTCGTDLKVFKRGYHARMISPPAVFGHELSGVIAETSAGAAAAAWKVGDRVAVANSAPCGRCFFCQRSRENLCDDLLFLNGAYAESIVVPARLVQTNLLRLGEETPFVDAALIEPLACAVLGVEDARLRADHRVLVIGSGPIGLMFVALARHAGATVVLAGRGKNRLTKARKLGATETIDVTGSVGLEEALAEKGGAPFDVVIEAVGRPETWKGALRLVRKGGLVNFFGGCPTGTTVPLDAALMHYSSLKLVASFHHTPRTIRRALELIEGGVVRAADFVDGEVSLEDLPELFRSMAAGNRAVKTRVRTRT